MNEAATGVSYTNAQVIQAGATGQNSQVVLATAVDPDTKASFKNNLYKFADSGTTTDSSGLFHIDSATGQITTTRAVVAGDAGQKTLKVIAYDGVLSGPAIDYTFTIAGPSNQPPSNIRFQSGGTVNENAGSGAAVGTVTANDDGGTSGLRYSIANNSNFVIDAVTGAITVK
ncbi:hypothetical protein HI113_44110, partial [Corallococcus exiguus]|uniref:hypothetical protein n=1 Tax=Corallococcus exiguus TaxID=83462 RepID=UPI001831740D